MRAAIVGGGLTVAAHERVLPHPESAHVDLQTRWTCPPEAPVAARLAALRSRHAELPHPRERDATSEQSDDGCIPIL